MSFSYTLYAAGVMKMNDVIIIEGNEGVMRRFS